jgi:hypothetical protein
MVSGQTTQSRPTPTAAAQNCNDNYLPCVIEPAHLSRWSPRQLSPVPWQADQATRVPGFGLEANRAVQQPRPPIRVPGHASARRPHGWERGVVGDRNAGTSGPAAWSGVCVGAEGANNRRGKDGDEAEELPPLTMRR